MTGSSRRRDGSTRGVPSSAPVAASYTSTYFTPAPSIRWTSSGCSGTGPLVATGSGAPLSVVPAVVSGTVGGDTTAVVAGGSVAGAMSTASRRGSSPAARMTNAAAAPATTT